MTQWLTDEELKQAVNLQIDEVDFFRRLYEMVTFPHPATPVIHILPGKEALLGCS